MFCDCCIKRSSPPWWRTAMNWDCTRRLTAAHGGSRYLELLGAALPHVQEALGNGCLHLSWVE
eukprot:12096395-Heterocapsa_arctica.AAC.1